ncbi:unnamed protein product [Trichobilharzia regenti]|nr:unnamed protein product [Trichobilharzia regenti]
MDDAVSSSSSTHHYGDNTISNNNNNDNNHEDDNPHKCSGLDDSITYTVNASNTTTDINNNNNNPHKRTQHRLFIGKEKIRNFFISYEFWIFIVPLLITVIFVIFLSISFGYAFISNSSKVDEDKEPCGSQSKF